MYFQHQMDVLVDVLLSECYHDQLNDEPLLISSLNVMRWGSPNDAREDLIRFRRQNPRTECD